MSDIYISDIICCKPIFFIIFQVFIFGQNPHSTGQSREFQFLHEGTLGFLSYIQGLGLKSTQNHFRESLGTPLDKNNVWCRLWTYPAQYGQNQFLTFFQKMCFLCFLTILCINPYQKIQNSKNIGNYEVFHKSTKCFNIQLGVEKNFGFFRFCF